jgi:hypothetical protein
VTNTTNKDGFYRLNGASPATYQTTIGNADIANYSFDLAAKMQAYPTQLNKFLRVDNASGYLTFVDQSTSTPFSQITSWPGNNTQVVLANGAYDKLNFFNVNSGNDYTTLTPGKGFCWFGKNIDIGEIITQTTFRKFDDILSSTDISDAIIPAAKLTFPLFGATPTNAVLFGSINGENKKFLVDTNQVFKQVTGSAKIVGFDSLKYVTSPVSGQLLSYDTTDGLKWVDGGTTLSLLAGQIQIGNTSNVVSKQSIQSPSLYDDTYFSTSTVPPANLVLCTHPTISNAMKWQKITANNIDIYGSGPSWNAYQYLTYSPQSTG